MKVSREGIVLIKSFEGFRPRAERLEDGRWVIGYGHTRSAREGATVGEGDAELLLQYDLMPVVAAIQDNVPARLNQHQIDALASYALSVGVDAFSQSPVVRLMAEGRSDEAAAALLASNGTGLAHAPVDPVARRRAAERALFVHDPDQPVALASLLSIRPPAPVAPSPDPAASRAQAVAALLGEPDADADVAPEVEAPAQAETTAPSEPEPDPAPEATPIESGDEPSTTPQEPEESAPELEPQAEPEPQPAPQAPSATTGVDTADTAWRSSMALTMQRYSPYAGRMTGPLPGFGPATTPAPATPDADGSETSPAPPAPTTIRADSQVEEGRLLILTPPPEVASEPAVREVWSEEQRHPTPEAEEDEAVLFGDELTPEASLQVLRHEDIEPANPNRFDWSETGAFLGMGAVGLVAVGASVAGFNLASEQIAARAFDETTMVSWVLALIGALCVGVAAFNLYLRWDRRDRD